MDAIHHDWRGFLTTVGVEVEGPCGLEPGNVRGVDGLERRVVLLAPAAAVNQPVPRLLFGVLEAGVVHVGGTRRLLGGRGLEREHENNE
ncbi:MAG: hypothetical protein WDO68_27455 [Gammaproteobacteria bacterium]